MQDQRDNFPPPDDMGEEPVSAVMDFLQRSVMVEDGDSSLTTILFLMIGGVAALYVRFLYRRFSTTASGTDSVSRTFPLLLIVTTAVIAVVKSSLALSLGLVGALSIVRFRAAIKDPEELVYLFLCIAVGLALGAQQLMLAGGLLAAATVFVLIMHATAKGIRNSRLLLTIRGAADLFKEGEHNLLARLDSLAGNWEMHRMDIENGRGQIRIALPELNSRETTQLIAKLSEAFPDCELSWVNLNSAV